MVIPVNCLCLKPCVDVCPILKCAGNDGGAIFLVQPSQVIMNENTSIVFSGNSAYDKGGAIFLQTQQTGASEDTLLSTEHCFLQTTDTRPITSWEVRD